MSSFLDDLLDLLMPDLVTALSLSTGDVYRGERAREAQRTAGIEVWLRPRPARSSLGGLGGVVAHGVDVHLRLRAPRESDMSGATKGDTLATAEETVRRRYDGTRPFVSGGMATALVCLRVGESFVGDDQGPEVMDRYLELTALERS